MTGADRADWQDFIKGIPQAHILQTPAWGELKSNFGWQPFWVIQGSLGAQILIRQAVLGYRVAYIPRGPVSSAGPLTGHPDWESFWVSLDQLCRERNAVFLKLEPDGWEEDHPGFPGCQFSANSIQPPRTVLVDLTGTEDQILARMKSKTRYNIRLSSKKGVSVRRIEDLNPFYSLLEGTAERADFGIHTRDYYQKAYELFHPLGECALFLAEFEGLPLASIMVFMRGERSWYFYGASSRQHRELMAPYLVQWEAMRWVKSQGCKNYDLWGVPDEDLETLEGKFTKRTDGLWGVYRFKRGFGGQLKRSPGPWDRIYHPGLYKLYKIRNRLIGTEE